MRGYVKTRAWHLLGATAIATCTATPVVAQETSNSATEVAGSASIADIVVTAQRREERIQDVPIAITAFSTARLDQQGINDAQDLQGSVPSLVVNSVGQQSRDVQSITLRGQGASFQASPGVVIYLNEVPLPAPTTRSLQGGQGNWVDLENVQVLAGPQGTLFGRNTTGGAVLLVPKKPTDVFGGWIQGRYGNYDRKELEGAINIPILGDKLAIRASGAFHDRDGFTRDIVWDKDRDDEHWYSGRLGIIARPTETIENYLMIYGSKSSNNGVGVVNEGFNIAGLQADPDGPGPGFGFCVDPPAVPGFGQVPCDLYRNLPTPGEKRQTAPDVDVFSKLKTWGATNTTDFQFTDELKLRNIVSYHKLESSYALDWDGTVLQQQDASPVREPAPGQVTLPFVGPITYLNAAPDNSLPDEDVELFTEELQLQGDLLDKKLQFTVGGFYSNQTPGGATRPSSAHLTCPAALTGSPLCAVNFGSASAVLQRSKALYGQATLDFGAFSPALDGLRLTGGYRKTWDRIEGKAALREPVVLKSSAPSWLIGLDYRVIPEIMLFGKVSRGYKSGGYNASAVRPSTLTFGPETVTNYEAGFKSDFKLADMPVRLNGTYYNMDYKGIQRATADFSFGAPLPGFPVGGAQIVNADARIQGIELEASIQPFRGVEVGGNFSWTHGKYKKYEFPVSIPTNACNGFTVPEVLAPFFPGAATVADFSCTPFNGIAKYSWSAHVSAQQELANDLGTVVLFVNYSHSSSIPTLGIGLEADDPLSRLEAFGLLNASLDWNDVAGSGFDLGLFVTNATNRLYRVGYNNGFAGFANFGASLYGEPRMYGLKLRYKFGGG